ncbi:MAG: DNA-directed RNA polymerase alpha chain [candidate division WS6 bacterium GW2011_GWF2_39_15]|uniref:DNA-directed RNA polymerase subunit alpha n=1 Tax=candidate division WS6 bacterium GW2011_GWF2_39_15 TaxID=1619100 RepID=A0A0G0MYQ9_9BACT|nr:MAG: DNA-directed RNA polymerase alpha chain [candidate division WS6 bacterium GW2011_GWF2_39_15]
MLSFEDITVKVVEEEGNAGKYEISPLPKGYGHTLVNSLRRILLSSLGGSAITSVRIKGVEHEYSAVKGIKEDVVEIVLNLKQIRFKVSADEPQICKLQASGKGIVTAKDISVAAGVEVTNPEIVIANLTDDKASLVMEIVVEKGVGYREADDESRSEVGRIPVDADFSPIKSVNFEVTDARKGQMTNLDAVKISIETDGSIAPKQALLDSAKILQDFSGKVMVALGVSKKEVEQRAEELNTIPEVTPETAVVEDEVSSWKVEDLPISKRSKSGLLAGGFQTVGDLSHAKVADLLELPGFGNKSLNEVVELMKQYGIEIKSE